MELILQLFRHTLKETDHGLLKQLKTIRQMEYDFCFRHNVALPFIQKLHIFLENPQDRQTFVDLAGGLSQKLQFIDFGTQPTYRDFIEYAQQSIPDDTLIAILNGDMIFDSKLDLSLLQRHVTGTKMFGLTRHELTDEHHSQCTIDTCNLIHNYWGSADVFILKTPILRTIHLETIQFKQNLFGAENIFQKTLQEAGYSIKNPCYQVRTFHVHRNRNYFHDYATIGNHLDFNEPPSYLEG